MDPEDPDHSQNLIISSFYHFGHTLKILTNRGPKMTLGQVLWRSVDDLK